MASSRIAGITIEIGGDTTKLQSSLKAVDKQLSATQSNLKDIEKLLKFDPGNVELLTQKQKNLTGAIENTEKRLKELKDAQAGVQEGTDEWDKLQREIIATEQDLDKLKQEYKDFGSVAAQQVAAAGKKMEEFGNKVTKAGQAFQPISTAATAALSGLTVLAMKAVTTADDLNTLSKQTGFTTEEIQKMKYAADLVDVSFEDIEGALKKLKPKITENNKALAELVVSTKNADGSTRDATAVFYDAIEALSKIPNETERDQKAMELFGKSADSLAGIIDDGGAALKAYGEQAEQMGLIMGQDTVDNLNKVNDAIDTLKAQGGAALAQLGATVATVLGPAIEKAVGLISKVTEAIAKLTPEQAETILKILAITAAIGPLLKTGGKLISGIGTALKLAPKIVTAVKLVGAALSPTTLIVAGIVALVAVVAIAVYKNWDKIKAWTNDMVNKVKGFFEDMKKSVTDTVNKVKDTVTKAWNTIKTDVTNAVNNVKKAVSGAWDNVKTATTNALESAKSTVSTKLDNIKTSFTNAFNNVKSTVSGAWDNVKTATTNAIESVKATVSTKLENIKTSFTNAFNNVKSTVSGTWDSIKSTASTKIEGIRSAISTAFTNVANGIQRIMNFDFRLPTLSLPTWDSMKGHFSGLIQTLKNAFNFSWSLPHVKLPHFKVKGGKWPYGLGGEGYLPSVSIEWYKKAYQNPIMFTQPTVTATPQGYKGFGDRGAEIVLGLNKLQELVGGARPVVVNVHGVPGQSVDDLADAVIRRITNLQMQRNAVYA